MSIVIELNVPVYIMAKEMAPKIVNPRQEKLKLKALFFNRQQKTLTTQRVKQGFLINVAEKEGFMKYIYHIDLIIY